MLILTSVTYSQKVKFKTITVQPYLSFQNYEHFKRLTLTSLDSHAEYIAGFEFEWGYTYKLKVKETKLKSSYSDGTQFEYVLKKVVSKTKAADSSAFTLMLDANRYYYQVEADEQEMNKTFHQINDSTFSYFDKVEIEVSPSIMQEFNAIVEGKTRKMGTFVYLNAKKIRLVKL